MNTNWKSSCGKFPLLFIYSKCFGILLTEGQREINDIPSQYEQKFQIFPTYRKVGKPCWQRYNQSKKNCNFFSCDSSSSRGNVGRSVGLSVGRCQRVSKSLKCFKVYVMNILYNIKYIYAYNATLKWFSAAI